MLTQSKIFSKICGTEAKLRRNSCLSNGFCVPAGRGTAARRAWDTTQKMRAIPKYLLLAGSGLESNAGGSSMKKISSSLGIILLMLAVMSCGLINRFTSAGVENLQRANDLWPDVPRMDGLEHSDLELPLTVKLIMRAALNNLWRLNKEGEDKTPVEGDWVVYSTRSLPADVESFYTNSRMTSFGNWDVSGKSTCIDGKDKGWQGIVCGYQKKDNGKDIMLLIVAGEDEKTKQTNVFYLRLEAPESADNTNRSRGK